MFPISPFGYHNLPLFIVQTLSGVLQFPYGPHRCCWKSHWHIHRRLHRRHPCHQVAHARCYLWLSCVWQYRPPGPCLCGFIILSEGSHTLYYDEIEQRKAPKLSSLFPKPTPTDPSDSLPVPTYKQFLSQAGRPASVLVGLGNTTSAMYIAALDGTEKEVIVNSTARYNENAHRILASAGFAPELHFCGRVVGGLYGCYGPRGWEIPLADPNGQDAHSYHRSGACPSGGASSPTKYRLRGLAGL